MEQVLMLATVLAPIATALMQLVKKTLPVRKNFIPAITVGVGVVLGALAYPFADLDLVLRLWSGGMAGLSATGLYEIRKNREGMKTEA